MARMGSVGAVETVEYRRVGVEVSLSVVGSRQVNPFGDGALHLQELLPRRFEAVDAAPCCEIKLLKMNCCC